MDKTGLKTAFLAMMNNASPGKTKDDIAQEMADAIEAFVLTAAVTTTVTGTCSTGPVAGAGTGTLT